MAYKDLTFLLFAKDMSASRGFEKVAHSADGMAKGVAGSLGMVGVAVAGLAISVAAKSVEMAGDFQQATMRLVTDAGESSKTIGQLSSGLLDISAETGTAATDIAKGMYKVSSAGYTMAHGGLQVMRAAAEGAKVGGADLTTVADALTTVMKDYGIGANHATNTTSELIATVSRGKTTMEDLAGSLHSVLPNAQALGISLNDVLGALATMTQEGISADQATQNLNHTIVSLANPTHVQSQEMAAMGLNATKVAANLGKKGLTGTLNELVTAITSHMGKGGLVLQHAFTNSALAAQSAHTMFKALPSAVKTVASAYMAGSITQKTWTSAIKGMTPAQANLAKQWAATENASKGFSQQLKSGSGTAQTFTGALAKMTGGQTGLQVALHITGIHAKDTADSVKAIGAAAKGTQKDVSDWDKTQGTFNQKMSTWDAFVGKISINIGTALLPAIGHFTDGLIHGAKQWGDIFASIGKWWGDTVHSFQHGADQIIGAYSHAGTMLVDAGRHIIDGLVNGIKSGFGAVSDAMGAVGDLVNRVFAIKIDSHSPSKVFHRFGSYIGQGLSNGILGSKNQVGAATESLANTVIGMYEKTTKIRIARPGADLFLTRHEISKATEKTALHDLATGTNQLETIAKKRAVVASRLKAAQTAVHDALTARKEYGAGIKSATMSAGDVTTLGSAGDMVQHLSDLVAHTKTFRSLMGQLAKKGIDRVTYDELAQAGVAGGGLEAAQSLLANPLDFRQVVSLQKQLNAAAGGLGTDTSVHQYRRTLATDNGRVTDLKTLDTAYAHQQRHVAASTVRKVAGDVNVHINLSGHLYGSKTELAKAVADAIRSATRSGAISRNALKV